MKIDHIRVSKFNAAELIKELNRRMEGRNCHGIFFNSDGLLHGTVEIHTTDIRVVEVDKPEKTSSFTDSELAYIFDGLELSLTGGKQ